MSENAKYSDLKKFIKDNSLANNYGELKELVEKKLDIDMNTVKFNSELLDKTGKNITVSQLNTMLKSL